MMFSMSSCLPLMEEILIETMRAQESDYGCRINIILVFSRHV
jgi:hypothetical protein